MIRILTIHLKQTLIDCASAGPNGFPGTTSFT